jgi:hypothetical protein
VKEVLPALVAAASAILLATACSASPDDGAALDVSGSSSGIRVRRNAIVRDATAFSALWRQHAGPTAPCPKLDFKACDVVVVFAGSRSTGGYSVRISEVRRSGKSAVVAAELTKPGRGAITSQAFTQPFCMKSVPKLPADARIELKEIERT